MNCLYDRNPMNRILNALELSYITKKKRKKKYYHNAVGHVAFRSQSAQWLKMGTVNQMNVNFQ